jgi:hypothetical protein
MQARERFTATAQTDPAPYLTSSTIGTDSFPGVKGAGRNNKRPLHLAQRLKKEYRHTSTPPLYLHILFYGEIYIVTKSLILMVPEKKSEQIKAISTNIYIILMQLILTLSLLMSYIYGAPCEVRNFNVLHIWTYVWQH